MCWKNAVQQTVPKPAEGGGPSPNAATGTALCAYVSACVWGATLGVGEAVGGGAVGAGTERLYSTLHHLTAALVTPAGNLYHHPCYTGSQSGGLIVLYL